MSSDKKEQFDLQFNYFSDEGEESSSSADNDKKREGKKSAPDTLFRDTRSFDEEEERPYLSRSLPIALKNKDDEEHCDGIGTSVSVMPIQPLFDFSPVKGKNRRPKGVVPMPTPNEETVTLKK